MTNVATGLMIGFILSLLGCWNKDDPDQPPFSNDLLSDESENGTEKCSLQVGASGYCWSCPNGTRCPQETDPYFGGSDIQFPVLQPFEPGIFCVRECDDQPLGENELENLTCDGQPTCLSVLRDYTEAVIDPTLSDSPCTSNADCDTVRHLLQGSIYGIGRGIFELGRTVAVNIHGPIANLTESYQAYKSRDVECGYQSNDVTFGFGAFEPICGYCDAATSRCALSRMLEDYPRELAQQEGGPCPESP